MQNESSMNTIFKLNMIRRKTLLKRFSLTEVCDENAPGASLVELSNGFSYYRRAFEFSDKRKSTSIGMAQFPIVFDTQEVPWADAIVFIILVLLSKPSLDKGTFTNLAADLALYREFLDVEQIDWTVFPEFSSFRPTYRFQGYLRLLATNQEISHTIAKRVMNNVVGFYRLLIDEKMLTLDFPPWEEEDVRYEYIAESGFTAHKFTKTTDVSLKYLPDDGVDTDFIYDEGKLRPLSQQQEEALFESLIELENVEVTLIHLVAVDTACRIQTILTLQLKHLQHANRRRSDGTVLIPAGKGTGIDTKFSKNKSIKLSCWILDLLIQYSKSQRAVRRQMKHKGKGGEVDYLFLTPMGNPFYGSKADTYAFADRSYTIRGGSLRRYVTDFVIPRTREKLHDETFYYSLHWLRATGGMRKADHYNEQVESGTITRVAARDKLRRDMWHAKSDTTDGYLDYRKIVQLAIKRQEDYEIRLEKLMKQAMEGL